MFLQSTFQRLILISFCTLLNFQISAQAIKVHRVEPPNWWTGMKLQKVQLILYGENLKSLSASFDQQGIKVIKIHELENQNYALIDMEIDQNARSGDYRLTITGKNNAVTILYPLQQRQKRVQQHQGFSSKDVIYLIVPDRFANGDRKNDRAREMLDEYYPDRPEMRHGGDLQGIIDHLDYLQDLGITTIWLTPVLENNGSNSYHGYAATDLYRIDPRFGSNQQYQKMVDEAHKRDIKVIYDHVSNHIGINHPWMQNLPLPEWVNGSIENHLLEKHYKESLYDPHADKQSVEQLETFWFVDGMPDLNQRQTFVSNYIIQNTIWWIEFAGFDGIREDTYPYPYQSFMSNWTKAILNEYPNLNIVGECWSLQPAFIASFQKGSPLNQHKTLLPSVMDFPFSEAIRKYILDKAGIQGIYEVFTNDHIYGNPDNLVTFFDNHDMTRLIWLADRKTEKVKIALHLLMTTRGIPQILYGTEINLLGGASHVKLRQDFPGGFPGQDRSAFNKKGRTADEDAMYSYVQSLLQLRKKHPALSSGRFMHYPPVNDIYCYVKMLGDEQILSLVNGGPDDNSVTLMDFTNRFDLFKKVKNLRTGEELPFSSKEPLVIKGMSAELYLFIN